MADFTKILWIELIGFDRTAEDYGVSELLSRMLIPPSCVSLLLWNTELIHRHTELEKEDAPIGAVHCSYYARPRNEERKRQEWTKFELRGLIRTLHQYDIKVFVSFFDQIPSRTFRQEHSLKDIRLWVDDHPEVFYQHRDGTVYETTICPLKHLADGRLYEDFFFEQLENFMNDYGFDGLHCADGYALPRFPIHEADFSSDLVGQFTEDTGISVPTGIPEKQAQWIIDHVRLPWIEFMAERNARFWRKGMDMLKRNKKDHLFNSCWTRDPLEAEYRYGIDYRRLAKAGVVNWVAEAQAAVVETEGWNHSGVPMQDFYRAMLMRLKACLPESRIFLLNCIKDGLEQYNVLRHAPAFMDSDIYGLTELFHGNRRLLDGMVVCLADGIRKDEWHRLDKTYMRAFKEEPVEIPMPRVLWSAQGLARELPDYVEKHRCSSFRLLSELIAGGAVIGNVVTGEELAGASCVQGPLVLVNPFFLTSEERTLAMAAANGEMVEVGLVSDKDFVCRIYHGGKITQSFSSELSVPDRYEEVSTWLTPLPEAMPEKEFFLRAAAALNEAFALFQAIRCQSGIRLSGFYDSGKKLHLFIENEKHIYQKTAVKVRGRFASAEIVSDEMVMPPHIEIQQECTLLSLKLPPNGTIPVVLN